MAPLLLLLLAALLQPLGGSGHFAQPWLRRWGAATLKHLQAAPCAPRGSPQPECPPLGACPAQPQALSLQCIRDQKIPIALGVIIAVLVSVIIALAVRAPQAFPPPIDAACPDDWIGNRGKCYFFSEMEGNWTSSQSKCSSLSASLAVIDSPQDLDFMLRYKGRSHHWIGLWKELDQPWKWPNGTEFNNMFPVRGEGQCAFLNDIGVSSSRCYSERGFICSRPDDCTRRKPSAARGDAV